MLNGQKLAELMGVQQLKNIEVVSVGLVDDPAIGEFFTEFKSATGRNGTLEKTLRRGPTKGTSEDAKHKESTMDEKEVKALLEAGIKAAIEPLSKRLDEVTTKVGEFEKSGDKSDAEAVKGLKSDLKAVKEGLDELKKNHEGHVEDRKAAEKELVEETCKRFESVEEGVEELSKSGTQKIEGEKKKPKNGIFWKSLIGSGA